MYSLALIVELVTYVSKVLDLSPALRVFLRVLRFYLSLKSTITKIWVLWFSSVSKINSYYYYYYYKIKHISKKDIILKRYFDFTGKSSSDTMKYNYMYMPRLIYTKKAFSCVVDDDVDDVHDVIVLISLILSYSKANFEIMSKYYRVY